MVSAMLPLLLLAVLACLAQRPPPSQRRFVSVAVDKFVANLTARLRDPMVATMFAQVILLLVSNAVVLISALSAFPTRSTRPFT